MKKYLVIGGDVISKNDGDQYYINAHRLCELYGLNPREHFLAEENDPSSLRGFDKNIPILRPRYDGNYSIRRRSPQ